MSCISHFCRPALKFRRSLFGKITLHVIAFPIWGLVTDLPIKMEGDFRLKCRYTTVQLYSQLLPSCADANMITGRVRVHLEDWLRGDLSIKVVFEWGQSIRSRDSGPYIPRFSPTYFSKFVCVCSLCVACNNVMNNKGHPRNS